MVGRAAPWLAAVLACAGAPAQTVYTYIGQVRPNSVLIAWGNTLGRAENTIGRDSVSLGAAQVRIAGRTLAAEKNWIEVTGLEPDTAYPYEVLVDGKRVGGAIVRTWPERASRMTFFVIGDYGTGGAPQRAIAEAMTAEFQRRMQTEDPVRFVLTVGDNIYADLNLGYFLRGSGSQDRDWGPKFFEPYRAILEQVPFLPTLGNHDGNTTENRADLGVYLDNFFFPGNRPARWYQFDFGGLADFFALDSTDNTTTGHPSPASAPEGEQSRWLAKALSESTAPWKIPYFHHPPFNAGPGHGASYKVLRHWVDLFTRCGVKVAFTGHEHNYQFSESNETTGGVRYVISGAGGELRSADVTANMRRADIAGWSATRHFLVVEIDGKTMRITPLGASGKVVPTGPDRRPLPNELEVKLP
jgi:hypothetical protein